MRFVFGKKRHRHEKSIDDLKKEYDKNGEYRHIVVNENNIPLWCCKSRQDAVEKVTKEWLWNFKRCEIVDLLFYVCGSKQKGVVCGMARKNGELRTCDRCGKQVFLKTNGDGETDGGYTRWNKFEEAKGWSVENNIGDLCPDCSELYDILKQNFKREVKKFKENNVLIKE